MTTMIGNRPSRAFHAFAFAFVLGFCLAATGTARAEEAADKVVATVDGQPITVADLEAAVRDMQQDLAQVPVEQRMQMVVDTVVEVRLFEKAAEKAGLDKDPAVERRLAFLRGRALRNEYLLNKVTTVVTPETIKKRYDEETAKFVPGDELHLVHILVKTEDEAKAIIADLDKGGDFDAIAKEKSLDPGSATSGGDLGFIGKGKTVQPFEEAAFKLDVGSYTKAPVQTQFGWHVIKLLEKRKEVAPTLADKENAIRQELLTQFLQAEVKALRDGAKVEIIQAPAAEAPATPAEPAPATPAEPKPAP